MFYYYPTACRSAIRSTHLHSGTRHIAPFLSHSAKNTAIFLKVFSAVFSPFREEQKTHKASCKKYKPYILKYKALISKYVPYIFREKRHLIFSDLQNRKNSVFPHRCARKKIIRNGMYTSPQTVHRFRRADGFYTHAACVSKAPECRCKNTV